MSSADLDRRLQALATAVDWPAEADIAARLELPVRRRPAWLAPQARAALAGIAVLVLALSAVLVASPATRSAVARLLGFPGVTVEVPSPGPPAPTGASLDLGQPMTLAQAQARVDFPLRTLPLDAPQVTFDVGTGAVHLRYDHPTGTVLLTQLDGEADLGFVKRAGGVKPTAVRDAFALWATGPDHTLLRTTDGTTVQAKLSANALLWSQDQVTYRLEIDADLETAVALADLLR